MGDFWNRLDDIMKRLPDEEEEDSDTIGSPMVLYKGGGGTGTKPAPTNPPNVTGFFDSHYDRVSKLANEMNVSPNALLGLSAGESSWGQPIGKNNLFGLSDAKGKPLDFDSYDDSVNAFRNSQWYSRLQNKNTPDDFVNELLDTTGGKLKYNSVNPNYDSYIHSMINTVDRRLPIWQQSQSSSP